MNFEWYLRTDVGRESERQGTQNAASSIDVLRAVLADHAGELAGLPFSSICVHVTPAQSERTFEGQLAEGGQS